MRDKSRKRKGEERRAGKKREEEEGREKNRKKGGRAERERKLGCRIIGDYSQILTPNMLCLAFI